MMSNKYSIGQSSANRKARLDHKQSLLPVPRRVGSTDRMSTEARRPSNLGSRSSSAEPRPLGGSSATKMRSRSQTADHKYGQLMTTPLRSSHYSRNTTTPIRTPDDRQYRNWESCLERALAFYTIKDQRPIGNSTWVRTEHQRVCAEMAAQGLGGATLVRPLTITCFVNIVAELLNIIILDTKLSTDSYINKLPHVAKMLLYPSPVAKSWLRTVNTLHTFPQALALIGYLMDLAIHCQMPISEETLYVNKDEVAVLQRDYLKKCWARFQDPDAAFTDLNEDYLANLQKLLGNDDEKILKLERTIKELKSSLEDEEEMAARADEERRIERRDGLLVALRTERAAKRAAMAEMETQNVIKRDCIEKLRSIDTEIERLSVDNERLREELAQQPMSVEERERLLDGVNYSTRVYDSKIDLAEQLTKSLLSKEAELAQWQKRTLDSCVEYKQGLIHMSTQIPALANLAIDEKELMGAECAAYMAKAVATLREESIRLNNRRTELVRSKSALSRKRAMLMEETRNKIAEVKSNIQREQQCLDSELAKEASEASQWSKEQREVKERLEQLRANLVEYAKVDADLEFWQKQDAAWRSKLSEMNDYIKKLKQHADESLVAARDHRLALVRNTVASWNIKLEQ